MLAIDISGFIAQGVARGSDQADYTVRLSLRETAANTPSLASLTVLPMGISDPIFEATDRPLTGNVKFH
jgi:hypothetical protein